MEKNKLILAISIIVGALILGGSYFFGWTNNNNALLIQKEKCHNEAVKQLELLNKDKQFQAILFYVGYSKSLNTCVYEYLENIGMASNKYIIDAYSGEILANKLHNFNDPLSQPEDNYYQRRREIFFGE